MKVYIVTDGRLRTIYRKENNNGASRKSKRNQVKGA